VEKIDMCEFVGCWVQLSS